MPLPRTCIRHGETCRALPTYVGSSSLLFSRVLPLDASTASLAPFAHVFTLFRASPASRGGHAHIALYSAALPGRIYHAMPMTRAYVRSGKMIMVLRKAGGSGTISLPSSLGLLRNGSAQNV